MSYTFTYDEPDAQGQPTGAGRLTTVTEPERTVKLAYHLSGRLKSEPVTESGVATPLVTGYECDADGALDTVTYPSGLRVKYDRDQATREVWAVRNPDSGMVYAGSVATPREGRWRASPTATARPCRRPSTSGTSRRLWRAGPCSWDTG